jgi:hypothetical protein
LYEQQHPIPGWEKFRKVFDKTTWGGLILTDDLAEKQRQMPGRKIACSTELFI